MVTLPQPRASRRFRVGELRAALVQTGSELLAQSGLAAFSVAEVARRLGISTAAPYRHFPDRDHLLAAVATDAGRRLAEAISQEVEVAGADPEDRFAAAAAAYVRFVATRRAGFPVVFAPALQALRDEDLAEAGRQVMDVLLATAQDTGERPIPESLLLVESLVALAQGYATLFLDGFFDNSGYDLADVAARAAANSRRLLDPPGLDSRSRHGPERRATSPGWNDID